MSRARRVPEAVLRRLEAEARKCDGKPCVDESPSCRDLLALIAEVREARKATPTPTVRG